MANRYRKKPVVIEAKQATGTPKSNREIIDWTRGSATPASMGDHPERGKCLSISTLEGAHWVSPGDWIIKGVAGEFYPCKPDIFAATYEPVETALAAQQPAATSETVNVIGMPEFDQMLDHIYEHGTAAEGVIERANAFARAVIARYAPQQPAAVAQPLTDEALLSQVLEALEGMEEWASSIFDGYPPSTASIAAAPYRDVARAAIAALRERLGVSNG